MFLTPIEKIFLVRCDNKTILEKLKRNGYKGYNDILKTLVTTKNIEISDNIMNFLYSYDHSVRANITIRAYLEAMIDIQGMMEVLFDSKKNTIDSFNVLNVNLHELAVRSLRYLYDIESAADKYSCLVFNMFRFLLENYIKYIELGLGCDFKYSRKYDKFQKFIVSDENNNMINSLYRLSNFIHEYHNDKTMMDKLIPLMNNLFLLYDRLKEEPKYYIYKNGSSIRMVLNKRHFDVTY